MMFGEDPRLPMDLVFGRPPLSNEISDYEYVNWLEDTLHELHDKARATTDKRVRAIKDYHDRGQRGKPFETGDMVWILKPVPDKGQRKWQRRYLGPYRVVTKISNTTYQVQDIKPPFEQKKVHFNRLKKCTLPEGAFTGIPSYTEHDEVDREQMKNASEEESEEEDEETIIVMPQRNTRPATPVRVPIRRKTPLRQYPLRNRRRRIL